MEFSDDSDKFKIFGFIHVKFATIFCGVFGILATVVIFCFGFAIFPWAIYENAVNITAMTAFLCFLIGGCTVHSLLLHGLKQTRFRFMIPTVIYQTFLMCLNAITTLIAIGELVSDGNLSPRDEAMTKIVLITCPIIIILQSIMLLIIGRCRYYIQCKRRHIRNGLPPPVREVIMFSSNNKVSIMELSFDNSYQVAETMMPTHFD